MVRLALRKFSHNPGLVLSLFVGVVVAVALFAGIPLYTDGVLQRLLVHDLEELQRSSGKYPGSYLLQKTFRATSQPQHRPAAIGEYTEYITTTLFPDLGVAPLITTHNLTVRSLAFRPIRDGEPQDSYAVGTMSVLQDLLQHIVVTHGRLPEGVDDNGVLEIVVTEAGLRNMDLRVGEEYLVSDPSGVMSPPFPVRVVGTLTVTDSRDVYWYRRLDMSSDSLFVDAAHFADLFPTLDRLSVVTSEWFMAIDYRRITVRSISAVLQRISTHTRYAVSFQGAYDIPMVGVLEEYQLKQKQLLLALAFLQVPVMIMLAFYLYMASVLIVEGDRNEIALIKSRGGSLRQIFGVYVTLYVLLALAALALGPLLGLLACQVVGSTDGFLEFTGRRALPLGLTGKTYAFSLAAVGMFLLTVLIPAYRASGTTIVLYKQSRARGSSRPLWQRFFLDVVLLALAGYGLYGFRSQRQILRITGAAGSELPLDPLLFAVSTLFVLGGALVFLRVFPLLIRFVLAVGRRLWPPSVYGALVQLGRTWGLERYALVFLTLTLATGVFSASAARTVNNHVEDRVRYQTGADVALAPFWAGAHSLARILPVDELLADGDMSGLPETGAVRSVGREPPYEVYGDLAGVSAATRVFRREDARVRSSHGRTATALVVGVIPEEFALAAWSRPDIMPAATITRYLETMAVRPNAVLISRSLRTEEGVERGDTLTVSWSGLPGFEGLACGIIDYWPTYNPFGGEGEGPEHLVVVNFWYLQAHMPLEPYEIWIRRDADVPTSALYGDLVAQGLRIVALRDAAALIRDEKGLPALRGLNGTLTLGFLVTLVVCAAGFLLCAVSSIRGRVLQFGILRAAGFGIRNLVAMILTEQLAIAVGGVGVGIFLGGVAGQLYIPLLQLSVSAAEQVLPFQVGVFWRDYRNLLSFSAAMFVTVTASMAIFISRIQIHRAIKLGEE